MSYINEKCFDQSCESKQATPKKHCLNKCLHNPGEYIERYINKLESAIKADCKIECLEELKAYMESLPTVYYHELYRDKKGIADEILTKINDKDFIELAIKTLNHILLDNFHENLKYGEKHLDIRLSMAKDLFGSQDDVRKDIGAKAILQYSKNDEISSPYQQNQLIDELVSYKKLMGLEALKYMVQNTKTFDRSELSYFHQEIKPRNTEKVKLWADTLGEIVNDSTICCKGRAFAYKQLIAYKNDHNAWNNVFKECHNNNVCIKDITASLEHVDNWMAGITKLADYPFYCGD